MVHHVPRGFIARTKFPLKLLRTDALLRAANHVDRKKPFRERKVRIMGDCSGREGILIAAVAAAVEVSRLSGLALRLQRVRYYRHT